MLDSIHATRITTLTVTMPKFLVAQFNTHRAFSRNSASSRAIPSRLIRQQVVDNPYIPTTWPTSQRGMAGGPPLDAHDDVENAKREWLRARDRAVGHAWNLERQGVAKEIANRLLEPWMWTTVLITATDFQNFFSQRLPGHGAQAEMEIIARKMHDAIESSTPRPLHFGQWHLPFVAEYDPSNPSDDIKRSVARCARVSYLNHGKETTAAEDIARHDSLRDLGHWSPFEHQARAGFASEPCRNFTAWKQYRAIVDGVNDS